MAKKQRRFQQAYNSCKQKSIYTLSVILSFLLIGNSFKEYLYTLAVKQNFVAFFVSGETTPSFSTNICSVFLVSAPVVEDFARQIFFYEKR
jgi:hypothetical protein